MSNIPLNFDIDNTNLVILTIMNDNVIHSKITVRSNLTYDLPYDNANLIPKDAISITRNVTIIDNFRVEVIDFDRPL